MARQALGTDFGLHDPRWMSRFHSEERQVPRYRDGRVLLAGDAAHVHSPAGGQGMNTSIQDAANLGWKLAATVRGWAPDGLLDTYHAERHPVGRQVLRTSGALLRIGLTGPPAGRGRPEPAGGDGTALRWGNDRIAGEVSGIALRYPAPPGGHRLVGTRAADLPLRAAPGQPGRLYEALRVGRFILVTPEPVDAGTAAGTDVRTAVRADGGNGSLLVRPDGYVSSGSASAAAWCGNC